MEQTMQARRLRAWPGGTKFVDIGQEARNAPTLALQVSIILEFVVCDTLNTADVELIARSLHGWSLA